MKPSMFEIIDRLSDSTELSAFEIADLTLAGVGWGSGFGSGDKSHIKQLVKKYKMAKYFEAYVEMERFAANHPKYHLVDTKMGTLMKEGKARDMADAYDQALIYLEDHCYKMGWIGV